MMEKRLGIIFLLIIVPIVLGVKDKSSEKNVEEAHVHTEEGGDIHPPLPSSDEDTSDRQRDSQELKGNKLTKNDESSSDQQQIPTNQQQLPPDQQQLPPDQQQVPLDQQQLPKDDSKEYPHETKENKDKSLSNTPSEPEDAKFIEGEELIGRLNLYEKAKGYKLLQEAAAVGNTKAQEHLAYGYLYGNVLQRNFTRTFEIFEKLAKKGVPSGQMGLGLMYSMGIGVNSSQAKAILYYTFGALGYNPYARMAMGYRSFYGVGTPQSCESALSYYSKVAETVINKASIFAGSHAVQKVRLTQEDDESNVFGGVTEDEVDHYREVFADSGAQLSLGLYYLLGLGGVERNLPQALELLRRADSPTAYALIGRIYAEGSPPEIQQNNKTAIQYFKRAIEHKTPEGYTGLGIMYFKGMGVEQDYQHAMEYFQKAADKGSPEAHLYIGLGHLYGLGKPVNPNKALSSLKLSAQGGHVLALYHLANIYAKGLAGRRNCNQAVELYKSVAERGKWSRLLREAHRLYLSGDSDSALMIYLHLGEMGIEVAQCNAAYILEEGDTVMINQSEVLKRALMLWSRSATQGYSVARVKLGDYYYYGHGTEKDLELAADQYRMASDRMASAQAMFNLGYMYEQGIGLQQDFHLAKRYYDMAAETSADAAVPVTLALLKLNSLFYFQAIHTYLRNNDQVQSLSNAIHSVLGDQWDIYLIAVLCVVLAIVVRWYRR